MLQPADAATPAREAWAGFRIGDRAERVQLLQQLLDGDAPVHLSAPQGVAATSRLWTLDAAQQQIALAADAADPQMQALAQCEEAVAVAYLDRVKLQFELDDLLLLHGPHHCVLRARLPERMYRFQRRAAYRVLGFDRHGPKARLRHPSLPDMQLALRIVDLSIGGIALLLPDDVPALQPGSELRGVRIELDDDGGFEATLRLQHVSTLHGAGPGMRLGCAFADLDGAAQRQLQRYIDRTQQRRRLLALR
jgi:c-di-GMP-binding flagellar brake protein YcgR